MKAITLQQPWASLVAAGHKRIENRTWCPPAELLGERIAIHAGGRLDPRGVTLARALAIEVATPRQRVVAHATIVRVVLSIDDLSDRSQRRWWIGPFAWELGEIEAVDGPEVPGLLGVWDLDRRLDKLRRAA